MCKSSEIYWVITKISTSLEVPRSRVSKLKIQKSQQFQSESKSLRNRRADGISSSSCLNPKAGEDPCPSSKTVKKREHILFLSAFLFYSVLQWTVWDLLTLGRTICSTQSSYLWTHPVCLTKYPGTIWPGQDDA